MANDRADDEVGSRSGLLPPDGVAWPPEPLPMDAAPVAPDSLPTIVRRSPAAAIADWRTMPVAAPDGYRCSASAPPQPAPRVERWSVAALVVALVGLIPMLWRLPLLPALAVGFGLAGRRACSLDATRRGRVCATLAVAIGAATLLGVAAAVAAGGLTLFDV